MGIINKIFGNHSSRELKQVEPIVRAIEALEDEYRKKSDAELRDITAKLKERVASGETLDNILPEAFATAREAADRVLGMRPFKVQLIGGIVLHQGRISEMKTGEGKTLVSVLPAYLNALAGNGVHIVTVNDYLARRDSEWMGKVHRFLGLKVGLIVHGLTNEQRREAYAADITYATNNELGFDYLRDNMAIYKEDMVGRGYNYAIVDEVDSILIDEARTPLIISGQGEKSTELYEKCDRFVATLRMMKVVELNAKEEHDDLDCDYVVDEKSRTATLSPSGIAKAEAHFGVENLSDLDNTTLMHHINIAMRARGVMRRDIDYVVKDGEVLIVDENTGRIMYGRRYSEGLHQAIEAKERVKVERESKTLATITFQNFFRLYAKLSGMTGTALTEEEEFRHIYKLDAIEIPTNREMVRQDHADSVYKNQTGKYRAVIRQVVECVERDQPVLVGTISIEKSEMLSSMLKREGIKHVVLNAKHHDKEADIVAQAGKPGAVTIATNMAGRGTDIMLGGNAEYMAKNDLRKAGLSEELIVEATGYAETDNEEIINARKKYAEALEKYKSETADSAELVRKSGGLFIIGTERHESRRIDNQLRGRSGRQGDPGESRFYLALDDDLMRLFGSTRVAGMMDKLGIDDDTPIEQKMLTGAIETAQKKVESRNFLTRKHVLEYDDVMNKQREIIYGQRKKVLDGEDLRGFIMSMIEDVISRGVDNVMGENRYAERFQIDSICEQFEGIFMTREQFNPSDDDLNSLTILGIKQELKEIAEAAYQRREDEITPTLMREIERVVLLQNVDAKWMDHIDAMHELRQGINLRAFAQQDPVQAYKREGFDMFDQMINSIRDDTVRMVLTVRVKSEAPKREQVAKPTVAVHGDGTDNRSKTVKRSAPKIGRNELCPCGSGKKYKKCCGFTEGPAAEPAE